MMLARALARSVLVIAMVGLVAKSETPTPPSAEDFVRKILAAIQAKNRSVLEELAITESEFKDYVWPSVASQASMPGMTRDKYCRVYANSSRVGLTSMLDQYGGKRLDFVKVSFGPEQKVKNGRLLRNCDVVVRDEQNTEKTMRLAGVVLERGGSLKVATFYSAPTSAAKSN